MGCKNGWSREGFRVDIECPGDGTPKLRTITDLSGEPKLFESIDEAVIAARVILAEMEEVGAKCVAHISYYESKMRSILLVLPGDPSGELRLPGDFCPEPTP